jgi:hypothetical protein
MNRHRLLRKLAHGSLGNVRFGDFVDLVEAFGFHLDRRSGSHHIYIHPDVPEFLNLQDVRGEAKPYQVRQFLKLVERYDLRMEESQ